MLVISVLGITKAIILPIVSWLLLMVRPFKGDHKKGIHYFSPGGWALLAFSITICIIGIRDLRALPEKMDEAIDTSAQVKFVHNGSYIYLFKKDTLFYKFHFTNVGKGDISPYKVNISAVGIFKNENQYVSFPLLEANLFGLLSGQSKEIKHSISLDGNKVPDSIYFQLKSISTDKANTTIIRWYPGIDSIQTVATAEIGYLLPYLN